MDDEEHVPGDHGEIAQVFLASAFLLIGLAAARVVEGTIGNLEVVVTVTGLVLLRLAGLNSRIASATQRMERIEDLSLFDRTLGRRTRGAADMRRGRVSAKFSSQRN